MTQVKLVLVSDEMTELKVLALKPSPNIVYSRSGYGADPSDYVIATVLTDDRITPDPFKHKDGNTMRNAHVILQAHWDELADTCIIDVREFVKYDDFGYQYVGLEQYEQIANPVTILSRNKCVAGSHESSVHQAVFDAGDREALAITPRFGIRWNAQHRVFQCVDCGWIGGSF